jgi:[lysine-biosynthesis-protein LysW]--L-2-aminoadipate ligase
MTKVRLGLLYSRVRYEERLLIEAANSRNDVEIIPLNTNTMVLDQDSTPDVDLILDREISQSRALHILQWFESSGIKTINCFDAARIGGDKVLTSFKLHQAGVPTPKVKVAFDRESAMEAIEEMGYPIVIKPVDGSWGRLIGLMESPKAAEAILEHKSHLKSYYHGIFYLQEFIEKPDRDIRAFYIGGEVVGATYRTSEHWVTNAARGAKSQACEVTEELRQICVKAGQAVGGDSIAVDLMETESGYTVHEVNCAMEFKSAQQVLDIDLPDLLINYCVKIGTEIQQRKEVPVG